MLNRFASWIALAKIRSSFVSKATSAFSLAAFGLANFASPLASLGVDIWRLKLIFLGSILFLAGYIAISIFIPPEFRDETDPNLVVDRMIRIQSWEFFTSRRDITRSIIKRYSPNQSSANIRELLLYASMQLRMAEEADETNWREKAPGLYYADLLIRQFDSYIARFAILFMLTFGIMLLFIPTISGVYKAFYELSASPSASTHLITEEDLISALRRAQSGSESKSIPNNPELKKDTQRQ